MLNVELQMVSAQLKSAGKNPLTSPLLRFLFLLEGGQKLCPVSSPSQRRAGGNTSHPFLISGHPWPPREESGGGVICCSPLHRHS